MKEALSLAVRPYACARPGASEDPVQRAVRQPAAHPVRHRAGFTLVELLVALTLGAVVTVVATRLLVGSGRAEAAVRSASDRMLALDMAAGLLGDEVRRGGFVPVSPTAGASLDPNTPAFTLWISPGGHGDALGVRYVDDRLADGPVLRDLRFEAGVDGRGEAQLYRRTATGHRQPLVQGIAVLHVTGWVDASGMHGREALAVGLLEPWLVLLELVTTDGTSRSVAVPLPSRPAAEVVRSP